MLVGHDVNMHIFYRFHGWLIFAEINALYDENWVYILWTQLVGYHFVDFVHTWYVYWWSCEHAHIIPISWLSDFARFMSHYVQIWVYILYTQLIICLLVDFVHIWYEGWAWCEHGHILPISQLVDFLPELWPFVMKIDIN